MKNYIYTNNGSFYSQNELKHWLYIRKEQLANGKWRYYYEKDKNKLNINKDEKYHITGTTKESGIKFDTYAIKNKSTNNKLEIVSKEIYDKSKKGFRLYVGNTPLSQIAKEQIRTGASFVSNLLKRKVQF